MLEAAILIQRQPGAPRPGGFLEPQASPTLWDRVKERFVPRHASPDPALSPDTVWDDFRQIEHMHAQINRLFEDAFRMSGAFPAPVAASNMVPEQGATDPVRHMQYMRQRIDTLFAAARNDSQAGGQGFEDGWSQLTVTPAIGIMDTGTAYEISVPLPGFDRSCIQVTLYGSQLNIVAERRSNASSDATNGTWTVHSARRFERHLRLPQAAPNPSDVHASYRDDVLRVVVPKARPGEGEAGRVPII